MRIQSVIRIKNYCNKNNIKKRDFTLKQFIKIDIMCHPICWYTYMHRAITNFKFKLVSRKQLNRFSGTTTYTIHKNLVVKQFFFILIRHKMLAQLFRWYVRH